MIRKIANKVLPPGSNRRVYAGRFRNRLLRMKQLPRGSQDKVYQYDEWIKVIEPKLISPVLKNQNIEISVVVPCYNTPERYIKDLIYSLLAQTYTNWQLCLADGSTNESASNIIKKYCDLDERIDYIALKKNEGISANTNHAIAKANGKYIAFLDHDDTLADWALNEVVSAIKKNPEASLFYSDEDRLSDNGKVRLAPLFKPDWSPDLFFSVNYVAHFLVFEKSLVDKLKGLRPKYDGSQDYDLVLRALDYKPKIVHIAKVLYHMRMAENSTARKISIKDYAHTAGNRAIADYFDRNDIDAEVLSITDRPTNHRIKYQIKGSPLASIIIPFKDKADLLEKCIQSIVSKTTYNRYELILISNNSKEKATENYLSTLQNNKNVKIFYYDKPFNYSELNNFGRSKAKGQVLVFLNNDTEVITPEWLEELIGVAQQPEIGAVGPLLLYPDDTIQHAGIIVGSRGAAGHIFRDLKLGVLTPFWLPDWPRNFLAVTGACLAVSADKFDEVKGFDEKFIMAGGDVVFGLNLYEAGYRNVYWPYAVLTHHESKSVGSYQNAPPTDYEHSMIRYKPYLNYQDPYFNDNLDIMSEIPILRRRV